MNNIVSALQHFCDLPQRGANFYSVIMQFSMLLLKEDQYAACRIEQLKKHLSNCLGIMTCICAVLDLSHR